MFWVYGHYNYFYSYGARIYFSQILTSEDGHSTEMVNLKGLPRRGVKNAVKKRPRRDFRICHLITVSFKYSYIRVIWNSGMAHANLKLCNHCFYGISSQVMEIYIYKKTISRSCKTVICLESLTELTAQSALECQCNLTLSVRRSTLDIRI